MSLVSDSKVWFVTGCSSGLGRGLVEELLASGERVVATLRRPELLAQLSDKYPSSQLLVLRLDVTNEAQITEAFQATQDHFGRLDVVVNNAAHGLHGEIEATSDEEARKEMEVLFWGPVSISKKAVKFMRDINPAGQGGRIINVSSIGGYSSNPTFAFYSSGKFALEGFTEALTKEMLPAWNIKAIIIEPGIFLTSIYNQLTEFPIPPAYNHPDSPTLAFRKLLKDASGVAIGDVRKAAQAFMKVAALPNPPLRIQLGTDSLMLIRAKAEETIKDGEEYAELAHSTNADGVDRDEHNDTLTEALKITS
ncbi:NAD(P)-binding protein [Amylocystis lapponica]|nr:NAD(P)-binding protein [Amylocystis lapponica]